MEEEQLESYRQNLLAKLESLLKEGDLDVENTSREGGADDVVTKVDEDAAPLSEMNQVIASSRNLERANQCRQIEQALRRIEEEPEDFGLCEVCEEEIPARRMQLMPWTTLCVRCQSKQEEDAPTGRKHLTDYR